MYEVNRALFTVQCPIGDAAGSPHPAVFDFETLSLSCEKCRFSASQTAAAAIYAICGRVVALEALFAEVEAVDPGRYREGVRRLACRAS